LSVKPAFTRRHSSGENTRRGAASSSTPTMWLLRGARVSSQRLSTDDRTYGRRAKPRR